MTELELLKRLKAVLVKDGWVQNSWVYWGTKEADRGYCIDCGLIVACNGCVREPSTQAAMKRLVAAIGGETKQDIIDWNDEDERTFFEVLQLLDDVIAALEEQESGAPLPPLPTPSTLHYSERAVV